LTVQEICEAANRNEELPDLLPLHDQLLFLSVRQIYNDFRSGRIEKEQAAREKNRLVYQHNLWMRQSRDHVEAARRYQAVTIATETARADFRKLLRDGADDSKLKAAAIRLIEIWDGTRSIIEA